MDLVLFFQQARGREGAITLPKYLLDAVRDNEPSESEVHALIQAIDSVESAVCNRIDAQGLVVLCSALLSSPPCLSQRRGFYLISESLYQKQSDSPEEAASKRAKKSIIGNYVLNSLIKYYTDLETSRETQRWVGILTLELLENCPENSRKLSEKPEKLSPLSGLLKRSNCRILTLITGSIIRILLNNGVNPKELYVTEGDRILYSQFPRSDFHNMWWVSTFVDIFDELIMANVLPYQGSNMLYAFGLDAGTIQYNSVNESAILVTLNRDLMIIISASPEGPAIYVDVPGNNITDVQIVSEWNEASQARRYAVIIRLSQIDGDYWFHNAVGQDSSTITIAFTSQSPAEILYGVCRQSQKARLNTSASVMESQPIDCSELGPAAEIHETTQPLARSVASAMEAVDISIQQDQDYDSSYDLSPRPPRTQPKNRSKITHEGIASANRKPKSQKSQLTKAKESTGRGKALKGKDQEVPKDEYDLPRSPEEQVRKSKAPVMQDKSTSQAPSRGTSLKQNAKAKPVAKDPWRKSKEANTLTHPTKTRSRRTAAVLANQRIQAGIVQASSTSAHSLPPPNPDLLLAQETSSYGGVGEEAVGMDLNDDIRDEGPEARNREMDFLPDSTTKGFVAVSEAQDEAASTKPERSKVTTGSSKAPDPFEAKLRLLSPDDETTTSHPRESAGLLSEQDSKASKEDLGGRRHIIQPKTHGNVGTMQHQKKRLLNDNLDLSKGHQLQLGPQKDHGPVKQSVLTEQERGVKQAQLQQATSEPNALRLPTPAVENKRKAVDNGEVTEKKAKLSSQNTRVAESGSPMPSMHPLNRRVPGAKYDERGARIYRPILPRPQTPPREQWGIAGFKQLSSNTKVKCGLPTAPSNFTAMAAHRIIDDGTLVNVETDESIVPQLPQDPFNGNGQAGPSDLILALRREGGTEAHVDEDQDQTLVDGQLPQNEREDDEIPDSSTTTSSSSESTISMDPSTEEGNAVMMAEWRSRLLPYQRRMVRLLSDVTQQLSERLTGHEQEVEELVRDYRSAGNYALDLFVRDRDAAFDLNEAQLQRIRGQLSASLESSLQAAMENLNGLSDERREFMERFNAQQGEEQGEEMDTAEED